jgi:hypothetical protein
MISLLVRFVPLNPCRIHAPNAHSMRAAVSQNEPLGWSNSKRRCVRFSHPKKEAELNPLRIDGSMKMSFDSLTSVGNPGICTIMSEKFP